MDVKAVATLGRLRFMLHDYAHGGPPDFYLNISELEIGSDLVGLNVGHPIKIEPAIVAQAEAEAERIGLDEARTLLLVISYVLSEDSIEEKLGRKRGGVPKEMAPFFQAKSALELRAALRADTNGATTDVKAAPRRI